MQDHYAILGIAPAADFAALKRAYYLRAKECHPDRFGGDRRKEESFKQLVEAFHVLSDPLRRSRYDADRAAAAGVPLDVAAETVLQQEDSILGTFADDILEEMIVGNTIPPQSSLATLMLDLERTERFCLFREAKNLFYGGNARGAARMFEHYLTLSPANILAHYFLGRSLVLQGLHRRASREYARAIQIGERRRPPLPLHRIRKELDALRRNHLGFLGRVRAMFSAGDYGEPLPPDEEMRRAVSRAINKRLIAERAERRRLGPKK